MFTVPTESNPLHIAAGLQSYRGRHMVSRSDDRRAIQDAQRAWLSELMRVTNQKPSQLASTAKVSDSTLTRLLNNPGYGGILSQPTIRRLTAVYRVPGPDEYARDRRPLLAGFGEAEPVDPAHEPKEIARILRDLIGDRANVVPWRLKTMSLEDAGYLPGDIVLVDQAAEPQPQDAVCAQLYDAGGAATIWRIYDHPWLVGAARERTALKPLLIGDRVRVMGVVISSIRPHRLSHIR